MPRHFTGTKQDLSLVQESQFEFARKGLVFGLGKIRQQAVRLGAHGGEEAGGKMQMQFCYNQLLACARQL